MDNASCYIEDTLSTAIVGLCGDAEPHKNWVDSMIPGGFEVKFHHDAVHGDCGFRVGKRKLGQKGSVKVININEN